MDKKKVIAIALMILPLSSFAVSNKGVERESRPARVTVLERCTSLRYRWNNNYLRCLHAKKKRELVLRRKDRDSIRGRSLKYVGNYRGSRRRNTAVLTAKRKAVSDRPIRTFSGTKRFSSGGYKKKTPNIGIYRGTLRRPRVYKSSD